MDFRFTTSHVHARATQDFCELQTAENFVVARAHGIIFPIQVSDLNHLRPYHVRDVIFFILIFV
jgi:hypothetical protein